MPGPDSVAVYPEYLTDPKIAFCPSAAKYTTKDAEFDDNHQSCFGYMATDLQRCAGTTGVCYTYLGWVVDRASCADETMDLPIGGTIGTINAPKQVALTVLKVLLPHLSKGEGVEKDVDGDVDLTEYNCACGNGGNNTVYRLREGIERFMITDINNPAASAKAQSSIWIMFDRLATSAKNFNHIPGGANVLYMDGHVEFMKYSQCAPAPVNQGVANIVGAVTTALGVG